MNKFHPLYGPIIGDIVGSSHEGSSVRSLNFKLFTRYSRFTDDTVMTIAVADSMMVNGVVTSEYLKRYGRLFDEAGYGDLFWKWLKSDNDTPYASTGNGAAMRVSPIGFMTPFNDVNIQATSSARISHIGKDSILGAAAIAMAVHMAWVGYPKIAIKQVMDSMYELRFVLDDSVETIRNKRDKLSLDCSARTTVPQAITAFLESTDFENAIRLAVYIGGDTDTIASMTGAIAAAFYKSIPDYMIKEADERLNSLFISRIKLFSSFALGSRKIPMVH